MTTWIPAANVSTGAGGGEPVSAPVSGSFIDLAWSVEEVAPGEPVELSARLVGFGPEAPQVTFEVYDATSGAMSGEPLATIEGTVEGDRAVGSWTPGDEAGGGESGGGEETPPTLRLGSSGADVETLQTELTDKGYPVEVDGKFGPETDGAVRWFQGDYGLDADGVVGPLTWAELRDPDLPAQPVPSGVIQLGATGAKVRKLQQALNDQGASPAVEVDGAFLQPTEDATRTFQRDRRLSVDGKVGPQTWTALLAADEGGTGAAEGSSSSAGAGAGGGGAAGGELQPPTLPPLVGFKVKTADTAAAGVPLGLGPIVPTLIEALFDPRWEPETALAGQRVTLRVSVPPAGLFEGMQVTFRIFEDDVVGDDDFVAEVTGTVDAEGEVVARWTVPAELGDADDTSDAARRRAEDPLWGEDPARVDSVADLQRLLKALFVRDKIDEDPGLSDNQLGRKTRAAIRAFKQAFDVAPVNGSNTPALRERLAEVYREEVQENEDEAAEDDAAPNMPELYFVAELFRVEGVVGGGVQSPLLRVQPPCRISLQLGDPNLFGQRLDEDTEERWHLGLKQRLQALGYHYGPIDEAPPGDQDDPLRYRKGLWAFKKDEGLSEDDVVDADLVQLAEDRLRERLVRPLEEGDPFAADDPTTRPVVTDRNGRIVLPGGITFREDSDLSWHTEVPCVRYGREEELYAGNPLLGKVPLIARAQVRGRDAQGAEVWGPAGEGVRVVFELVPASFEEPDVELERVLGPDGLNLAERPRAYVSHVVQRDVAADDPQRLNASIDGGGGKRGQPVAEHLFAPGDLGLGDVWPWVAEPGPTEHSVVVTTGPDGSAGVCFTPFRAGGEAYRVRAYVEAGGPPPPPQPPGDEGTEPFGPEGQPALTGELVVWKHLRIGRYLRKEAEVRDEHEVDTGVTGETQGDVDMERVKAELRKAYFLVEVAEGAASPQAMTREELEAAHQHAVERCRTVHGARLRRELGRTYDMGRLISGDPDKPFMITIGDQPGVDFRDVEPWFHFRVLADAYLMEFLHHFSRDGDPGLTLVQALTGDELRGSRRFGSYLLQNAAPYNDITTERPALLTANVAMVEPLLLRKRDPADDYPFNDVIRVRVTHGDGTTSTKGPDQVSVDLPLIDYLNYVRSAFDAAKDKLGGQSQYDSGWINIPFRLPPGPGGPQATVEALYGWRFQEIVEAVIAEESAKPEHERKTQQQIFQEAVSRVTDSDWMEIDTFVAQDSRLATPEATTSGVATRYRGAYVFWGDEKYSRLSMYDVTANSVHELGHVLHLRHHWLGAGRSDHVARDHDYGDRCVMGYLEDTPGDLCGRCLLHLRGWDINRIPLNNEGQW